MASCANSSSVFGPFTVWSKKDNSNWLAHVASDPETTADLAKARTSIENRSSSGAVKSRVVYRLSNDGDTWGGWTPLYSNGTAEQTNDGTTYGASFVDLLSTVQDKQLIQWGVEVINTSGTATEMITVVIKLDRKRS